MAVWLCLIREYRTPLRLQGKRHREVMKFSCRPVRHSADGSIPYDSTISVG
ncbi:hypothetical protein [uncultured Duncaniella sp.]|uniref:hypothetical protein n=1 Tax=uncultured Duncaniella sp. TaxID=2768039 RepID=UPI00263BB25B|nr:hypothetical protein [uncultured Duncaniella sp.]